MISASLDSADLVVDEVYGGGRSGNASDDPLPRLLGLDSGAGFRHLGRRPEVATLKLLALKTSFADSDWPDSLDRENGLFIYFGDQRKPGDLHQTARDGNLILRNLFNEAHTNQTSAHFPPIFLFGNTGVYRDLRFLGLAVPGAKGMSSDDDLVAVWRITEEKVRFQNYKAIFTILDVPIIKRDWIKDIQAGKAVSSQHAPPNWISWVKGRKLRPLQATTNKQIRTKEQQQPETVELGAYVRAVYEKFKDNPYGFEQCAMEIARFFLPNVNTWEITRPWRDGGRDAVGTYRLGAGAGAIDVEFAMEAKCFAANTGVGIKPLSRLISRLRHRQFGILVTTSYVSNQAYEELIQDGHPVIVISAGDIAAKLKERFGAISQVKAWLSSF